ncbi:MAG: FGGY family carbohydrate kinase [Chloroflexota bacterium]|nr:FGGY family carbohydrate kinase [Chloroflexota bacterium]
MTSNPLLVGVDIGTTSIKAIVAGPDGRTVGVASRPTPTHYPRPGRAHFLVSELWDQFVAVLRQVTGRLDDPSRIVSVAVTSFAETGMPIDAHGQVATDEAIAWFDTRTIPQAAWLDRTIGRDVLFARSGLSLQPIFTLNKLLWIKENQPDVWRRTARWLNTADYFAYRLSGVQATDYSLASRTLALDLHQLRWDDEIIRAAGLDPGLFAPLVSGGIRLGPILREVARETGLPESTIVASGGHDHVCGAVAAGVIAPASLLNSLGTAEALFLPVERPLTDPLAGRQGYTQGAHVVGEHRYVFSGQYTSGASVDWLRSVLGGVGHPLSHRELIAEAAAVPVGSLGVTFLPHLRMANPPHDDPRSRGAFVGLSTDVTRGALARAVFEGLAFETRGSYEPLLTDHGIAPADRVIAIGGGTGNELAMRIKASVMRRSHTVIEVEEATALGAAILAGLGAGVYADGDAAVGAMRYDRRDIDPDPVDADQYDIIYRDVYQRLYPAVAPLSHAIDDARSRTG